MMEAKTNIDIRKYDLICGYCEGEWTMPDLPASEEVYCPWCGGEQEIPNLWSNKDK